MEHNLGKVNSGIITALLAFAASGPSKITVGIISPHALANGNNTKAVIATVLVCSFTGKIKVWKLCSSYKDIFEIIRGVFIFYVSCLGRCIGQIVAAHNQLCRLLHIRQSWSQNLCPLIAGILQP